MTELCNEAHDHSLHPLWKLLNNEFRSQSRLTLHSDSRPTCSPSRLHPPFSLPLICQIWGTTALFGPVKGASKTKRAKISRFLCTGLKQVQIWAMWTPNCSWNDHCKRFYLRPRPACISTLQKEIANFLSTLFNEFYKDILSNTTKIKRNAQEKIAFEL